MCVNIAAENISDDHPSGEAVSGVILVNNVVAMTSEPRKRGLDPSWTAKLRVKAKTKIVSVERRGAGTVQIEVRLAFERYP